MATDPNEYDKIIEKLGKKYGASSIRKGVQHEPVLRIPSASRELNFALGGGIPRRRWSRFYGGPSSGKSMTCFDLMKTAQNYHVHAEEQIKRYEQAEGDNKDLITAWRRELDLFPEGMSVAYYNVEQQYDPVFTAQRGVDIGKLNVVEGNMIEEVGEKLENLVSVVDLHVIDSCSEAISQAELEMQVEEQRRGVSAKQWGLMLRRANHYFGERNTAIIVDQVRSNQRTGKEEPPGGQYIGHVSSMTVHFRRGTWLYRDEAGYLDDDPKKIATLSGFKEPDGMEIQAYVDKSRVGRPFRSARMRLDFERMGFDETYELMKAAEHYGLVERSGSFYHVVDDKGEKTGEKFNGRRRLREYLDTDFEARSRIVGEWEDRFRN